VTTLSGTDPLAAGLAALARADWVEARTRFEQAIAASECPEAWEGLSRAAWWQGDEAVTFAARERAHRDYRQAGDTLGAARMAMWLAADHLDFRGDDAVSSAWLGRARSLLGKLAPCAEAGYVTLLDADIALLHHGDPARAERLAGEALELARSIGDVGVEVVALAMLGSALVASGSTEEGLRRLDECAALAVAEEFAEVAAPGWALCHTVSACAGIGEFSRAAQWCRALHTWSAVWQARHFFGVCRTAYGEVLATGGDWPSAEQELLSALEDLRTTRPALAAPAAVRLGRLRVRQDRLAEARAAYESALPSPQAIVAIGELDLEAGDAAAAADAAHRALRRVGEEAVLERLPALELLARARAAEGDGPAAVAAADEVEREAERLGTRYMRGRGRLVSAQVLASAGEHDSARQAAEDAIDLFDACSAPYEAATARLALAGALEALGHPDRAAAQERAAGEAIAALVGRRGAQGTREELSPREVDILRLVAQGLGDAQIAERLFLSPHTVHRHIANVRSKLRVPSRAAAVAHASREGLL
jgi:ATP/maltotriose-dependent transcriptional regulator MalT